jgi:hypothetical protein
MSAPPDGDGSPGPHDTGLTALPPAIAAGLAAETEWTATRIGPPRTPRLRAGPTPPPVVVQALERLQSSLMRADGQPRFSPVTVLGEGSQGVVYRVADRDCRREVAFKLLAGDHATAEDVQRFVLEAQITAQLEHPGIVPVHDLGVLRDGTLYYSMKCVEGESLADHLVARAGLAEHRFGLLEIFLRLCQTLAFAHSRGVIHRDIKPRNIMVGTFGEVLLMDWGLAKIIGGDGSRAMASDVPPLAGSDPHRTSLGTAIGTPAYMSPEQASGDASSLDHRCDIYSLGVVLYEMLAGCSPYERGDVSRVLQQARDGRWAALDRRRPGLPRPLVAIVHRAMALDREERYQSVDALARDVRDFLAGNAVSAYHENAAERLLRALRRQRSQLRVGAWVAAAAVAVALTAALVVLERGHHARETLRAEAQQLEFAERYEDALGSTQRLLGLDPQNAWALRAQARLEQAIAERSREDLRRRSDERRGERNRAEAQLLVAKARQAEATGSEAGFKEAVEHYMAALGLTPQDESLRLAYHAAYDRLIALRRGSLERARAEDEARGAGYYVEAARRSLAEGERFARQAEDRRIEIARIRAQPTYGSDPALSDRLAAAEDAALRAEKGAATRNALALDALESALHLESGHPDAGRLMADWCVRQLRLADARGDEAEVLALSAKAARHDIEGRFSELLSGLGRVAIETTGGPARVSALVDNGDRVLRPTERTALFAPGEEGTLMRGRWLAIAPDGAEVAFVVRRGERCVVRLPPVPSLPEGVAFVPGGTVVDRGGRGVAEVAPFALARRETTCADWLAFLADPAVLAQVDAAAREGRTIRVPRSAVDQRTMLWHRERGGGFRVDLAGAPIDPRLPVTGISAADAEAYARWRAARDGMPWRLPTRDEWRFAMQGGDGRPHPWGVRFEARLVLAECTDDQGGARLPPGGSHPGDRSVQGVLDLAGSVAELTIAAPGRAPMRYLACGGSYRDRSGDAFTSEAFRPMAGDAVDPGVGLRLALVLP